MKSVLEILCMEWPDQVSHLRGLRLSQVEMLHQEFLEFDVVYSRLGLAIVSIIRDLREEIARKAPEEGGENGRLS